MLRHHLKESYQVAMFRSDVFIRQVLFQLYQHARLGYAGAAFFVPLQMKHVYCSRDVIL